MKSELEDARLVARLVDQQRGVFSRDDVQVMLAEKHPASFSRRTRRLEEHGVLRRFVRGWYVGERFDLATLSQRIAPESYVSFATVLAQTLRIGPAPERELMAVKVGRARTYEGLGYRIVHVGVDRGLFFGFERRDGVAFADPEKAVLDTLYFHLRGRRYPFDIFSDIRWDGLDGDRIESYLQRYRNPKFVTFVRNLLRGETS